MTQVPVQDIRCFPTTGSADSDTVTRVEPSATSESSKTRPEPLKVYDIFGEDIIPQVEESRPAEIEGNDADAALPPVPASLHDLSNQELLTIAEDLDMSFLEEISRQLKKYDTDDPDSDFMDPGEELSEEQDGTEDVHSVEGQQDQRQKELRTEL